MRGGSTIDFGWTEIERAHEPIRARRACENAGLLAWRFDVALLILSAAHIAAANRDPI